MKYDNAKNIEIGIKSENTAEKYLKMKGFVILARNFRKGHLEIDIVARESIFRVYIRFVKNVFNDLKFISSKIFFARVKYHFNEMIKELSRIHIFEVKSKKLAESEYKALKSQKVLRENKFGFEQSSYLTGLESKINKNKSLNLKKASKAYSILSENKPYTIHTVFVLFSDIKDKAIVLYGGEVA